MIVYLVEMACGDCESELISEVVGIYSTEELARKAASEQAPITGGVYPYELDQTR